MRSKLSILTSTIATFALILAGLLTSPTAAHAAIVLNANGVTVKFNETTQTVTNYVGNGTSQGDIVKYAGVATIAPYTIDCVIETTSVTGGTSIDKFDAGNAVSSQPDFLQSNVTTTNAGSVTYKFSFYTGGSYTGVGTGTPVILQNVYVNSYDLDASGGGSNQYTEFSGIQGYTLSSNTTTNVSSNGNFVSFKYNGASSSTNYSATTGSYTKGRVQVKYDNLSVISIKVGNDTAGTGGLSYFALDFSVGLAWTEGSNTITTTTTTNSYNSPPVSTNDSTTGTAAVAQFLTSADFGTYSDPDQNPWVSVSIITLPAGGTLQWYNGTSWVNVTVGQVITVTDLDANKLRYTSSASTSSDSFTFKVSDGLASSVSAYTLSITLSGAAQQAPTPQVITFAQPSNALINAGPLTISPTADSNLTVTVTSITPAVCTVSGFTITYVSAGTCTLTASQAGNGTYSAATDVTRSFNITKVPQTITFTQPVDAYINAGPLTVAPTANSGLTVSLASSTLSVCTVSGFTITYVSAGTCTLTASQAGNATYLAATDVTRSFNINKLPQVITFAQPANVDISVGTITVAPTSDSNLTVLLSSSTPAVCTVSGFVVTLVTTGACILVSTQAGNSTYLAATNLSRSFVITNNNAPAPPAPVVEIKAPDIDPVSGKTTGTTPVTMPIPANHGGPGAACLIDPYDKVCKHTVTIPGIGTFVLLDDGRTTFTAVAGFYGTVSVLYRVTDAEGRYDTAPVTVEVVNPNPGTTTPGGQSGSTLGTKPVTITPSTPTQNASLCLIDPADGDCKLKVVIPGVGTWSQNANGSVSFLAAAGFVGTHTIQQRQTLNGVSKLSPYTVFVGKERGPVTVTISGFADGSPALTAAIRAKIDAFLRAYPDYKFVTCVGFTEGPTVLKTDAALSKARAVNGCAYVKQTTLGKALLQKAIMSIQGVIEANHERKITITLND